MKCPWCAETIQDEALVCRFCGREVTDDAIMGQWAEGWSTLTPEVRNGYWASLTPDRQRRFMEMLHRSGQRVSGAAAGGGMQLDPKGCAIAAVLLLGVGLFFMIFGGINYATGEKNAGDEPILTAWSQSGAPSGRRLSIGDTGTLSVPGGGLIVVCRTERAFDEYIKLAVAKDTLGIAQLAMGYSAFSAPSGTRVRIIDRGFSKTRVRVESGTSFGEAGWVPVEFVK